MDLTSEDKDIEKSECSAGEEVDLPEEVIDEDSHNTTNDDNEDENDDIGGDYEKSSTLEIGNALKQKEKLGVLHLKEQLSVDEKNHTKKFRNEKFQVTKTERKMKISVLLYWSLAASLLVGATIIAVLIGTGIIVVKPLTHYWEDDVEPRTLQYNYGHWSYSLPHLGLVPNTFETQFKITNMHWDRKLKDRNSEVFKTLTRQIEKNIYMIFDKHQQSSDLIVKVTKFSSDKVIVHCSLWWKRNITWTPYDIQNIIVENIRGNNGNLHNQFTVDSNSVLVQEFSKNCPMLGCRSVDCEFSFDELRFFCLCQEETTNKMDCVMKNETVINLDKANDKHTYLLERDENTPELGNYEFDINHEVGLKEVNDTKPVGKINYNNSIEKSVKNKILEISEGSGFELPEATEAETKHESDAVSVEKELFMLDIDNDYDDTTAADPEHEYTTNNPAIAMDGFEEANNSTVTNNCLANIARHQLCDNLEDCPQQEDESQCHFGNCLEKEFPCLAGRCIPGDWKCDGTPDCDSGEDEVACSASCPPGQFLCSEGRCIDDSLLCDGHDDCGEADDEADEVCRCEDDDFQCQYGGGCVSASYRCDGRHQCPDRSDEWNCFSNNNQTLEISYFSETLQKVQVCADNWSDQWSSYMCSQMGFSGRNVITNFTTIHNNNDVYWTINSTASFSPEPMQNFGSTSSNKCGSNATVNLNCGSFDCGSWSANSDPWPSLALLFHTKTKKSCTATILSPRWLVTSVQCVSSVARQPQAQEWVVFAGPPDSSAIMDMESTQIIIVKNILLHPGTRRHQHVRDHDLALINLHESLIFSPGVGAVCHSGQEKTTSECVVVGWNSAENGISFSMMSQDVSESIVSRENCNTSSLYSGHLARDNFCVSTNCQFDVGSVLMCQGEEKHKKWVLRGILSKPGTCSQSNPRPDIFTNIASAQHWMENEIPALNQRLK